MVKTIVAALLLALAACATDMPQRDTGARQALIQDTRPTETLGAPARHGLPSPAGTATGDANPFD